MSSGVSQFVAADIRSKPKTTHRVVKTSVRASLRWSEDSLWCQDVFYLFLFIDGHFRHVPLCFIGCGTLFYRTSQCGPGVDRGGVIKISRCVGGLVQYKEGLISIARHSECCLQEYQEILHSNFYTCGFWFKDKIIRQFD